jgi:hypothetical protein
MVKTAVGSRPIDAAGPAVGVARMEVSRSYAGVGSLLQAYIDRGDAAAWEKIRAKIDYTYEGLDLALAPLEAETGFGAEVRARLEKGQKLLFKPNLVSITNIEPVTHGPGLGNTACTEWAFVAAVMRWFHDRLGLRYHQMCLGEAATTMSGSARYYTRLKGGGRPVTTEAAIEGRSDGFYGGWGFYFARKYLAESPGRAADDDPMSGYEESLAGTFIPPGQAGGRLMVYDLNRISDDAAKGRDVDVPGGENYSSIILHKAVVGGDPADAEDRRAYPGCVLVNLPRFKVHVQALFTNVIKNLGIGLYPMQVARGGACQWEYSQPYTPVPGMKGGIPHQVWVPDLDPRTCLPKRDADGRYVVRRTGGLTGTMIDIIKAVQHQDVYLLNIVDAIEAINIDHTGSRMGLRQPEGLVFAGLDPVATDLLCARYMFSNVGLEEAEQAGLKDGAGGYFPQRVPLARLENGRIATGSGYDCRLARDFSFRRAEARGLGVQQYHVVGRDRVTDRPLASVGGRLGRLDGGAFETLFTEFMYFAVAKVAWDLQATFFSYLEAVDALAGSSLKREFLAAFDEDGDGVVTYEEYGRKGLFGSGLMMGGIVVGTMGEAEEESMRVQFVSAANSLKNAQPNWNAEGHDINREQFFGMVATTAFLMSQADVEIPDEFQAGLVFGRGGWPGFEQAMRARVGQAIYGLGFPARFSFPSLYGTIFRYADHTQNNRRYVGAVPGNPEPDAMLAYAQDVRDGRAAPLDFTLYVPPGYSRQAGLAVPNVVETADPALVFTGRLPGGVVWPDLRLSDVMAEAAG